jgi:hypothetical protein
MTKEVRRRAFEMFFTTKPRGLGTGLGLALVRKVAEQAGGHVEVETALGKGTTVVMAVPAAPPQEGDHEGARPGAVILIADGRAAALIRHILESSGVPVRANTDPFSAEIWVVDPVTISLTDVKRWQEKRPGGRLVLFGRPPTGAAKLWEPLNPVTIESPGDFEALRAVLGQTVASLRK